LENVQSPIAVFGWLTVSAFFVLVSLAFSSVPATPPHAASRVDRPVSANPAPPARPRKRRRECFCASSHCSRALSKRGSVI
jgi:hypothetical protein